MAAQRGHVEVVKLLLAANPDVNLCSPGADSSGSALAFAAAEGHTAAVAVLLTAPDLKVLTMKRAIQAAVNKRRASTAACIMRVLLGRDMSAAVSILEGRDRPLARDVLRLWQVDINAVQNSEQQRLAMQQLVVGVAATHKQLQQATADITASAVQRELRLLQQL